MKTVVIWDEMGESKIRFFVVDRDLSHLNNMYINLVSTPENLTQELLDLVFDESDNQVVKMSDEFPLKDVIDGAIVIVAGFAP